MFLTPTLRVPPLRWPIAVVLRTRPSNSYRNWNRWWDVEMHRGQRDWVLAACFLLLHSFLPAYLPDDMCNLCCGFQGCCCGSGDLHKSLPINTGKEQKALEVLLSCTLPGAFCCSSPSLTVETDSNEQREAWGHATKVACQIGGYTPCIWVIWGAKALPHATV